MWCPNPGMLLSGTKDLGFQFICWWVSLHSYWLLPQTLPWQPNLLTSVVLSPILIYPLVFLLPRSTSRALWTFTLPYSLCVCQPKRTPLPFVLSPLLKSPISGGPNYYFFISPHAIPFLSIIPRKNDSFWEFSWNLSQMPNSVQQGTFQRH